MKTKFIIIMAVGALALVACRRENFASIGNDILKFSVGFAGSNEIVLSKGATLTSEDGTVSIPLSCTVTDGIEVRISRNIRQRQTGNIPGMIFSDGVRPVRRPATQLQFLSGKEAVRRRPALQQNRQNSERKRTRPVLICRLMTIGERT